MLRDQRHREWRRPVFAVLSGADNEEMLYPACLRENPVRAHCGFEIPIGLPGERPNMTGAIPTLSHRLRPLMAAICLGTASLVMSAPVLSVQALARGPDGIADVAERVIDAVVNISTSQTIEAKGGGDGRGTMPQLPPGSPFEEFFDDFFKNRRGPCCG